MEDNIDIQAVLNKLTTRLANEMLRSTVAEAKLEALLKEKAAQQNDASNINEENSD